MGLNVMGVENSPQSTICVVEGKISQSCPEGMTDLQGRGSTWLIHIDGGLYTH